MFFDRRDAERLLVLVVEPREFVAARLKKQVESLGHRVLGLARDGREAIAAARRLHPNLILMETALPGLDGIDTARAIVTEQPVPIILLTGYAGADLVRRAREAGVVSYLTSVDQKRLVAAIEAALERFGELRVLRRDGSDQSGALETGRLVDRAKKVLITRLGCSEADAFRYILERSRSTRRRLRETAWTIIDVEDILSNPDLARCLQLIFHVVRQGARPKSMAPRVDPATATDTCSESTRVDPATATDT
jgi:AmiR/NasT family two-component response regulator